MDGLIEEIKNRVKRKNDDVRIAISLVQHIPYDWQGYEYEGEFRYPYEVLYDCRGVCGEKSLLFGLILRELGYGAVLFYFKRENHMAVGIKSPIEFSRWVYEGTGYCFVETAAPTIPTYIPEYYIGGIRLRSIPEIIFICDGRSFETVMEEFEDARSWITLKPPGKSLDECSYKKWNDLIEKYGLD